MAQYREASDSVLEEMRRAQKRISAYLKRNGRGSQIILARAAGVSHSTIHAAVQGKVVRLGILRRIMLALEEIEQKEAIAATVGAAPSFKVIDPDAPNRDTPGQLDEMDEEIAAIRKVHAIFDALSDATMRKRIHTWLGEKFSLFE